VPEELQVAQHLEETGVDADDCDAEELRAQDGSVS